MYRVLIVDDEPYVAHAMAELLEEKSGRELDLYCAYHGKDALTVLQEGRVDLMLCDIRMPDMTGLQLQRLVMERWPLCRTVFLTAYSSFDYAYEALSMHAAGYILKSEPDDEILRYVEGVFRRMDQESAERLQLEEARVTLEQQQSGLTRYMLSRLGSGDPLTADSSRELYRVLGFDPSLPVCFALALAPENESGDVARARGYLEDALWREGADGLGRPLLFVQQGANLPLPLSLRLAEALDCLQRDMRQGGLRPASFLVSEPVCSPEQLAGAYARLASHAAGFADIQEPFVFVCSGQDDGRFDSSAHTVRFMCEYVDQNITKDVSLLHLSTLTGYNSEYLSRLFHRETGQTLSAYVTERRLGVVRRLLRDPRNLALEDVALQAGFSSRSYFNRFIKKATGLSPLAFRLQCRDDA